MQYLTPKGVEALRQRTKCLVTGATGLLGRETCPVLGMKYEVLGLGFRHQPDQLGIQADLRLRERIASVLKVVAPSAVIHMAAYRDPDFCELNPEECRSLNVDPCRHLAELLPAETHLVFISTDYVFDGTHPPYRETDKRSPVNVYGQSKCDAEDAVLSHPRGTVLRVPLLIGAGPTLAESGFIAQMRQSVLSGLPEEVDDVLARFPTWTKDVAEALLWILDRGEMGTWHYSSLEGKTRYGWTLELADLLGADASHLVPSDRVIPRAARRPGDSQLLPAKFLAAGYRGFTPFRKAASRILDRFDALP